MPVSKKLGSGKLVFHQKYKYSAQIANDGSNRIIVGRAGLGKNESKFCLDEELTREERKQLGQMIRMAEISHASTTKLGHNSDFRKPSFEEVRNMFPEVNHEVGDLILGGFLETKNDI
uniref:Transposase n=1 Tax=Rhabditophanes sp. KR3021 TaxID=114890 RepID=A0AC35UGP7_9BILA